MRNLLLLFVVSLWLSLAGCTHTAEGVKEDLKELGTSINKAGENVKKTIHEKTE